MTDVEAKLLRALCLNVYNLSGATLACYQTPWGRRLFDRLQAPKLGDVVMETSTIWDPDRDEHRIGRLLRIEVRPRYIPEKWRELGETDMDDIPDERYTIIEPMVRPGTEYHWTNASFITVPDGIATQSSGDPVITSRENRTRR